MTNPKSVGMVTTIRVRPDDQMSCIDIVEKAGALREGMSITAVVSRALSICCETLREAGTIPRRDGFEYGDMIAPFLTENKHVKRARILVGHELALADVQAERADRPRVPTLPGVASTTPALSFSELFVDEEQAARYLKWRDAVGRDKGLVPHSTEELALFKKVRMQESQKRPPSGTPTETRVQSRNAQRIAELEWKKAHDEDNWTRAEQLELDRLRRKETK